MELVSILNFNFHSRLGSDKSGIGDSLVIWKGIEQVNKLFIQSKNFNDGMVGLN